MFQHEYYNKKENKEELFKGTKKEKGGNNGTLDKRGSNESQKGARKSDMIGGGAKRGKNRYRTLHLFVFSYTYSFIIVQ